MQVSTLAQQHASHGELLVDTRAVEHHQGWPELGHERGGHLPGSRHFDARWARSVGDSELFALMSERGLSRDQALCLYGPEAGELSARFVDLGCPQVRVDEDALSRALSSGQALSSLRHFERLVAPQWLYRVLRGQGALHSPSARPLVVEVGYRARADYLSGHIPGALYLDTEAIERSPLFKRVDDERLLEVLLALGVTSTRALVLYSAQTLAAARVAHLLRYAGVRDVRLLEGGKAVWRRAGLPLDLGACVPRPERVWGTDFPGKPELFCDTEAVLKRLDAPAEQVLSVRSLAEYHGETSGYPDIEARGHIPGAVWAYSGSDAYHLEDFRNPDDTMRSGAEVDARWRGLGITPERRMTFYCGTAWRASEVAFYASAMGWGEPCVYDGGWRAWNEEVDSARHLRGSTRARQSAAL